MNEHEVFEKLYEIHWQLVYPCGDTWRHVAQDKNNVKRTTGEL
jgi:hypothetical protein